MREASLFERSPLVNSGSHQHHAAHQRTGRDHHLSQLGSRMQAPLAQRGQQAETNPHRQIA